MRTCSSPGSVRSMRSCSGSGSPVDRPCTYSSLVPRPSGSRNTWWLALSAKRTTLSSIDGQYRGPAPPTHPPYTGDSARCSRMRACVASVVRVRWQGTWGRGTWALGSNENQRGAASPGWASRPA